MLVLSRKTNEEILIGDDIRIKVTKVSGGKVQLGIVAPRELHVRRAELPPRPSDQQANQQPQSTSQENARVV
jgi:carbon storage regulator CsrA